MALSTVSFTAARVRRVRSEWHAFVLPALLTGVVLITVLAARLSLRAVPSAFLILPVLAGGLLAQRRRDILVVTAAACGGFAIVASVHGAADVRVANFLLILAVGWVAFLLVSSRERLGVTGLRGETMLVELRERLRVQGALPPLPAGWKWEMEQRSAGGSGFGGDFLVAARTGGGRMLEFALVDVSGKGIDAGTRALLLSGALGGLLGAVPPEQFLAAANAYLRRQAWDEGFATAIHVAVDLESGDYLLDSAGHPPAAQFRAGSGVWTLSAAEGSALGLFDDGPWPAVRGRLGRGDALLLFTDGLVEVPGRDLELGIDKLLGEANRLVISTFEGGAARLIDAVAPAATDDRALAMIWRA
ncbi:MAG TPA: PP2C family protein-serine/threonine phosphatase [Frankiaceae bacterium]|nr:PP2C family protein-serine/threonine phosphatase [Frankiaceae bacterium]